ncbi:MAG TPA: histidine kinase dimerization/phosphoacceptor domain -containing protein [bacterium]|nr:histidine kinase dimerization/phosphoacceptor domain -containing protein [bacterium]
MGGNKTLLLVEDEMLIAMSQKMFLERYGYKVLTTNTGEKAIEILKNEAEIELEYLPESRKAPLEKFGYRVITATTAEQAIELFKKSSTIDMVLMDIDLGEGMDGTQAAEIILRQRNIPILFLSSHTEEEVVERTEKITSYGYVVKNSSITVLDASIKMAFKLFDAYSALERELSERKEIEKGLETTRKELAVIKQAADATSEFAQSIINTVREPLISLDHDLRVVTVSRSFYELFKVKPEETIGQLIYDLGNKQWNIPKLRKLLEEILPQQVSFDDYEVEHDFATIGRRVMLLNARQIRQAPGKEHIILLAIEDITARRETEKKIAALLEEKKLILKEVHHRIKNSMNTIKSLLMLQTMSIQDPVAIQALEDTESRVGSMMLLYDKLYRSVDYTDMSVRTYLVPLVDEILANFPNSGSITVEKRFDDFTISAKVMQSIGIIVNELLTNIMKYAFIDRNSGTIRVSATRTGGEATITVQDDGHGVPDTVNFENTPGFGLMLVRTLTEQMGGTIVMKREHGTTVELGFKL